LFLPVMVVLPQKFAICFTLGCLFIMGSFFALKGPKTQFLHMISKEVIASFSIMTCIYSQIHSLYKYLYGLHSCALGCLSVAYICSPILYLFIFYRGFRSLLASLQAWPALYMYQW
jgi:hypothetical protein